MEIKIKSKKFKNKFIYGDILEYKNANTLVVLLSGFSGSAELPLFKKISLNFYQKGFSTLRLSFCNDEDNIDNKTDAFEIWEMSFSVYITELKNIFDSIGKKYSTIVLVGHSFGAPISIMFLNKHKKYASKTKLVLWDPSLLPYQKRLMDKAFVFDPIKKLYFEKGSKNLCIFNKKFYKELSETQSTAEILGKLNHDACIVGAGKGAGKDAKKYFAKIQNKKSSALSIIKGANHMFYGKRIQKELLDKTIKFLS
jgi:predicted alpha/beta-fold hydrolase